MNVSDCPHPIDSPAGRYWLRRFAALESETVTPESQAKRDADRRISAAGMGPASFDTRKVRSGDPDPADPEYLDWLANDRQSSPSNIAFRLFDEEVVGRLFGLPSGLLSNTNNPHSRVYSQASSSSSPAGVRTYSSTLSGWISDDTCDAVVQAFDLTSVKPVGLTSKPVPSSRLCRHRVLAGSCRACSMGKA